MSRLQSTFLAASLLALSAGAGIAPAAADGPVIAFLMPCSTCADRFEGQDKPLFIAAVKAIDPTASVIANNAQGSAETQVSQAEAALTNGAKVIVVSPLTEAAGAAIVDKAQAQGVPVLSYDGLLTGAAADFFVSFQNKKVGELQGQFLADKLPQGSTIALINGSQDIAPGRDFKTGAHRLSIRWSHSATWSSATRPTRPTGSAENAQTQTEQALTDLNDNVQAILAANDGLAGR